MSVTREAIQKELEKAHKQRGVGTMESQQLIAAMMLQLLVEIRDLLVEVRDQSKNVVVDFVSPDYGEESKL